MYKAFKTIDKLYIVADDKTCKPYSAMTYSLKKDAEKVAERLNRINRKDKIK